MNQKALSDSVAGVRSAAADYNEEVRRSLATPHAGETEPPFAGWYSTARDVPVSPVVGMPLNGNGPIDTASAADFRSTGTMIFDNVDRPLTRGDVIILGPGGPNNSGCSGLYCYGTWGGTGHIVTVSGYAWVAQTGWWAIGQATGPDAMPSLGTASLGQPTLGTATYNGFVRGDLQQSYGPTQGTVQAGVLEGTVAINANFASRTLSGAMTINNNGTPWASTSFSGIAISNVGTYGTSMDVAGGSGQMSGMFWGSTAKATGGTWHIMYGAPNSVTSVGNGIFVANRPN